MPYPIIHQANANSSATTIKTGTMEIERRPYIHHDTANTNVRKIRTGTIAIEPPSIECPL